MRCFTEYFLKFFQVIISLCFFSTTAGAFIRLIDDFFAGSTFSCAFSAFGGSAFSAFLAACDVHLAVKKWEFLNKGFN